MAKKQDKTNVMRIFDGAHIAYESHSYLASGAISGMDVADALNQDPKRVFKTLVVRGKPQSYYVFLVPVDKELDLKKAAKCVGEKKVEMIKQKELLPLTGYVHGGCSPVGMKKVFPTVIDKSAADFGTFMFNAGKIGFQVETSLSELEKVLVFSVGDIAGA